MGASAESKLEQAKRFDKMATEVSKRDPVNSQKLKDLANRKRGQAIKQLGRRPKKRGTTGRTVI